MSIVKLTGCARLSYKGVLYVRETRYNVSGALEEDLLDRFTDTDVPFFTKEGDIRRPKKHIKQAVEVSVDEENPVIDLTSKKVSKAITRAATKEKILKKRANGRQSKDKTQTDEVEISLDD